MHLSISCKSGCAKESSRRLAWCTADAPGSAGGVADRAEVAVHGACAAAPPGQGAARLHAADCGRGCRRVQVRSSHSQLSLPPASVQFIRQASVASCPSDLRACSHQAGHHPASMQGVLHPADSAMSLSTAGFRVQCAERFWPQELLHCVKLQALGGGWRLDLWPAGGAGAKSLPWRLRRCSLRRAPAVAAGECASPSDVMVSCTCI